MRLYYTRRNSHTKIKLHRLFIAIIIIRFSCSCKKISVLIPREELAKKKHFFLVVCVSSVKKIIVGYFTRNRLFCCWKFLLSPNKKYCEMKKKALTNGDMTYLCESIWNRLRADFGGAGGGLLRTWALLLLLFVAGPSFV